MTNNCGHWMWVECYHCKETICAYCGKSRAQLRKEQEEIYVRFEPIQEEQRLAELLAVPTVPILFNVVDEPYAVCPHCKRKVWLSPINWKANLKNGDGVIPIQFCLCRKLWQCKLEEDDE